MLRATQEQEWWADQVVHVMLEGKRALDAAMLMKTVLQWGRVLMNAETPDELAERTATAPASMGPRSHERGNTSEELLEELERRGLKLSKRILWVTDGGGGIIKALKDRYGKKLIHQRCTLHKDRNIQRHLPKR